MVNGFIVSMLCKYWFMSLNIMSIIRDVPICDLLFCNYVFLFIIKVPLHHNGAGLSYIF